MKDKLNYVALKDRRTFSMSISSSIWELVKIHILRSSPDLLSQKIRGWAQQSVFNKLWYILKIYIWSLSLVPGIELQNLEFPDS